MFIITLYSQEGKLILFILSAKIDKKYTYDIFFYIWETYYISHRNYNFGYVECR